MKHVYFILRSSVCGIIAGSAYYIINNRGYDEQVLKEAIIGGLFYALGVLWGSYSKRPEKIEELEVLEDE